MTPMSIGYPKALAIAEIVVGALLLVTSLLTSQMIGVAAGAILALLGVLMVVNPMLRIEPNEVQVRNPIGMTLKRYAVSGPSDLRFEGNALYHAPENKKISSLGFGADSKDVDALRAQLSYQGR